MACLTTLVLGKLGPHDVVVTAESTNPPPSLSFPFTHVVFAFRLEVPAGLVDALYTDPPPPTRADGRIEEEHVYFVGARGVGKTTQLIAEAHFQIIPSEARRARSWRGTGWRSWGALCV